MLEALFNSKITEKILLSAYVREEIYARQIASLFGLFLLPVQKQFKKLEAGGILSSRPAGRTRLYSLNPAYPFMPN